MSASPISLRRPSPGFICLVAVIGVALAGCSLPQPHPDLTRYYMLTPAEAPAEAAPAPETPVRVAFRSIGVPEFLRGKIMLVRLGNNEVQYVDEARWAEPIEPALARVLREDLARHGLVRVVTRPVDERDFDVVVQLRQFEGVLPRNVARISARIEIYTAGLEPKLVAQDDFSTEITGWDGRNYAQLAGKLSDAAAALAERIAALLPQKNS